MYGPEISGFSLWWICPILMIVMCLLMTRGRRGSMICGFGSRRRGGYHTEDSESALDILDKRYAAGEIDKKEYEEKKSIITGVHS